MAFFVTMPRCAYSGATARRSVGQSVAYSANAGFAERVYGMSADHSGFISANLTLDMSTYRIVDVSVPIARPACPDALLIDVLISANFC